MDVKIKIGFHGHTSDTGAYWCYETETEVDDDNAEFVGRDFSRLCFLLERGMADGQKVAYQVNASDDP